MMRKVVLAVLIMIALTNNIQAGNSIVANGSFEADGEIISLSLEDLPQHWIDVNLPAGFVGWVKNDWSTYTAGGFCLSLGTDWNVICNAGDMATLSQEIYLDDVTKIIFDLKLTSSGTSWNEDERSAVILVDDIEVWNSSNWPADLNDEYHNQQVYISAHTAAGFHKLSLAIKSDVEETSWPFVIYITLWDFVKFDTHCGGFGYLATDLNYDCDVNMLDVKILAEQWLGIDPNERYDLFADDEIDFLDFAVLAEDWTYNTNWENWQDANCFDIGLMTTDLDLNGIVNFVDFAILAEDWSDSTVDYNDISRMNEEWLQ